MVIVLQLLLVAVFFIVLSYLFKILKVSEKTKVLLTIIFLFLIFVITLALKMVSILISIFILIIIFSQVARYLRL